MSIHNAPALGTMRQRVVTTVRVPALVAGILVATVIAYSPALRAPFEFDDAASIPGNATIHTLTPVSIPLAPPANTSVAGRPIVNLSLAINVALNDWLGVDQRPDPDGANKTLGYHIMNVLLHLGCGMLLFGAIRRTARHGQEVGRWRTDADGLAVIVAALWLLHPIQTEAVNYIIQRTELIVSVCYAGALYAWIRGWDAATARSSAAWRMVAVAACLTGMGSKEVMITAPLVVVLYDRAFRVASFRELGASPGRTVAYLALAATSAWTIETIVGNARSDTVGYHLGITWYQYLYSQAWAVAHYLRLVAWPDQLTFDYGQRAVSGFRGVTGALILVAFGIATIIAWTRVRYAGWLAFLGSSFFLLLAPSSSVVPIATEIAAERRVYLALAPVLLLLVIGARHYCARAAAQRSPPRRQWMLAAPALLGGWYVGASRWWADQLLPDQALRAGALQIAVGIAAMALAWFITTAPWRRAGVAVLLALLACTTFVRSMTYADAERLWRDTVRKVPENPRAYDNLAATMFYHDPPRLAEARALYARAIALDSTYVHAWTGLASVAVDQGRAADAESLLVRVLRIRPGYADAVDHLGRLLLRTGHPDRARPYLAEFAAAFPGDNAMVLLATSELQLGLFDDAVVALRQALDINPSRADAMRLLGGVLVEQGHGRDAVPLLERALSGERGSAVDLALLSVAYAEEGRVQDAVDAAHAASANARASAAVQILAGRAMLQLQHALEAAGYFEAALSASPGNPEALEYLARARAAIRGGVAHR